ncbi:hypothetical protein [Actinocorallia sp. A-T 12471]|uniref:hypothetical protein n=1 Tax=Actinocorallia sp. A-T 12471 TaxID=3089813 RepID=UPI0029CF2559|nr:hypothetical protein [Actinocorallia sp. A-T 12471]MDX6741941.1 hypothetical protein [Actinocorallia sp. A-T 12471]
MGADPDELDYLRGIELLARELVTRAGEEGRLSHGPEPDDATPLQRTINKIASSVRHYHFEGDGCLEDRPGIGLGGAALITPGSLLGPAGTYERLCRLLGVAPRAEGWALWHTWDNKQRAHTLVTTRLATTEGLLENWSRGISSYPAAPERAHIAAVVRGWRGPIILSPDHARDLDLGGT